MSSKKFNYLRVSHLTISLLDMSRKDDLFNMLYLIIYFIEGTLPWISYLKNNENNPNKIEIIKIVNKMKNEASVENVCANLPSNFS